jgi:hypothetical protein
MQALFNYIISTENRYNNAIKIDEKELIVNTEITERDHIFVNRIGTVVSCPISGQSLIKEGDEVILHHNVFRRWFDAHREERNSASYLDENMYSVMPDQVFAYKNKDGWNCLPEYCFVKPIPTTDSYIYKNVSEEPLVGVMKYPNKYLMSKGIKKGDKVSFQPESEYEFEVNGEKLYRIYDHQITLKL